MARQHAGLHFLPSLCLALACAFFAAALAGIAVPAGAAASAGDVAPAGAQEPTAVASAGGSAAAHATEGVAATQQGVPAPLSHHPAYDKFKSFAIVWAAKVNSNYRCTRARAEVVRRGEAFVARYFALDPATIQTTVKPSTSKASPFVGIMRYLEGVYESSGATRAEALGGPFSLVKQTRITEIFRYSKDDWVY